jgi:hypothetical protein
MTTERFWGIRRSAQEGDEFLMVSKVAGEERRSKKSHLETKRKIQVCARKEVT